MFKYQNDNFMQFRQKAKARSFMRIDSTTLIHFMQTKRQSTVTKSSHYARGIVRRRTRNLKSHVFHRFSSSLPLNSYIELKKLKAHAYYVQKD